MCTVGSGLLVKSSQFQVTVKYSKEDLFVETALIYGVKSLVSRSSFMFQRQLTLLCQNIKRP